MNARSVQRALANKRRLDFRSNRSPSLGKLNSLAYLGRVRLYRWSQVEKAYAADRVSKLRLKRVPATIFTCALGKS